MTFLVVALASFILFACTQGPTPINATAQGPKEYPRPHSLPTEVCLNGVVYYEFDAYGIGMRTYTPKLVAPSGNDGASTPFAQACR